MNNKTLASDNGAVRKTVHIDLGARSYDIHIGENLLPQIADYVPLDLKGRSLFVLTDENEIRRGAKRPAAGTAGGRTNEIILGAGTRYRLDA